MVRGNWRGIQVIDMKKIDTKKIEIDTKKIDENEKIFKEELQNFRSKYAEKDHRGAKEWQKTVGAIIVEDGKVLLVLRQHEPFKGTWTLPGGHIDEGESDVKAVKREVKEETGLDFIPEYFGSYEESFDEMRYFAYVSIFYGKFRGVINKKKVDKNEIIDIAWYRPDQLKDIKVGFEHRKIIEEYFSSQ